jgi:hypothetical protein
MPGWPVYGVLIVLAAVALAWFGYEGSFEPKDLAAGLFALFGTFAGALLAFRLEESRDRTKETSARKAALNRALVVLGYHHNEIRTYRDLMAPHRPGIELAFNFPASQPPEHVDMRQRFDELGFLVDSSTPQVLFELIIEQTRFDQAMQAIRQRNAFYVERVQPEFARHGLNNRLVSDHEIATALGEYLYGAAMHGAQTMREHVWESNESLPALAAKLRGIAKELYPDEKFVLFQNTPLPNDNLP